MLALVTAHAIGWPAVRAASPDSAPPLPPPSGDVVRVTTVGQLQSAIGSLASGRTIVIAPGTYTLTTTLNVHGPLSNVTIRGETNNRNDVVLVGRGMTNGDYGQVQHGIWSGGAVSGLTIANLTIRDVYFHPIIFNAGTQSPRVYNVRLVNAGQQFIKSNPDDAGGGVDNGVVEYSVFEYETTARDSYTNGVDILTSRNWIIRHNLFRRMRAPQGQLAGPAILAWRGSSGTIAEGNTFIDCQREIAFGLEPASPNDHSAGIIRNNFIVRQPAMGGDVAISVFDSPNTRVLHNTVLLAGAYPNAVEYRFADTTGALIANNLLDARIQARDGATATVQGNETAATAALFVNPAAGDLHLRPTASSAIDRAADVADAPLDWDGEARPAGAARDLGADEYQPGTGGSPQPIACAVSAWGPWQPTTGWSACSASQQSRGEQRARAIVTPAQFGGAACPVLQEARSATQPCTPLPTPAAESCGDAQDNDGDGRIDEHCTAVDTRRPEAPIGLWRIARGSTVDLGWRAPISGGNPAGYVVEAGLHRGEALLSFPVGLDTSVRVPGVGAGKYYVRVRAANAGGLGPASNEVAVTVGCAGLPQAPHALLARVSGNRVALAWLDEDGCGDSRYHLTVGAAPGQANLASAVVDVPELAAHAAPGTYYARVATVSAFGETAPSNEVAVTLDASACGAPAFPTGLDVQTSGPQVGAVWSPANEAAALAADEMAPVSYALEVGSDTGLANVATFNLGRTTAFSAVAPPGTYYLRIRPTNVCGLGPASNEFVVHVH